MRGLTTTGYLLICFALGSTTDAGHKARLGDNCDGKNLSRKLKILDHCLRQQKLQHRSAYIPGPATVPATYDMLITDLNVKL